MTNQPSEPSEPEAVAKGVEHLQAAALEMISAARSFLDAIEELVSDPDKIGEVVSSVGSAAAAVTDLAKRAESTKSSGGTGSTAEPVQRIRVS
jgi:hypothetical protein